MGLSLGAGVSGSLIVVAIIAGIVWYKVRK